uniref:Antitoxin Xre/MbcA/ParS-like toxin-binding domain-containing protein n=1 Tax=Dechloromonas aromatica (strain RCB) TaxID=159087 RepID=Q47C97_DECAR
MSIALKPNPLSDRSRVLSTAVVEAARRLGLGSTDLNAIIGTSQPSASRLLNGKYFIPEGSKTWELSAHFIRLYRSVSSLVGGNDELARSWLKSGNQAFDNRHPLEVVKRVDGLLHVCEYLDAHRARV